MRGENKLKTCPWKRQDVDEMLNRITENVVNNVQMWAQREGSGSWDGLLRPAGSSAEFICVCVCFFFTKFSQLKTLIYP